MNIIKIIKEYRLKKSNIIQFWRNKGVKIGPNCEIYQSASFGSEPYLVSLGKHVRVNHGVTFVTHDGGVWVLREYLSIPDHEKIDIFGRISVGNNVHIGTNSIIMPGVNIGNNCIIGCGAIVTNDIPENSIAVGVPARVIKSIDEYYKKHKGDFDYTKGMNSENKRKYLSEKFNIE